MSPRWTRWPDFRNDSLIHLRQLNIYDKTNIAILSFLSCEIHSPDNKVAIYSAVCTQRFSSRVTLYKVRCLTMLLKKSCTKKGERWRKINELKKAHGGGERALHKKKRVANKDTHEGINAATQSRGSIQESAAAQIRVNARKRATGRDHNRLKISFCCMHFLWNFLWKFLLLCSFVSLFYCFMLKISAVFISSLFFFRGLAPGVNDTLTEKSIEMMKTEKEREKSSRIQNVK